MATIFTKTDNSTVSIVISGSLDTSDYTGSVAKTDIKSVDIGNSVGSIGNFAFSSCSNLVSVTIGNSVTTIGNSAFQYCTNLVSVTIGNSVTSIGKDAFNLCARLASVTIPNSVRSIGNFAFIQCFSLASVTIGNSVTSIGNAAFFQCLILASVTIGNSVESIGNQAFETCISLASVTIPDSVTSIGNSAFEGCSAMTFVTLGTGLNTIGDKVFKNCTNLVNFYPIDNSSLTLTTIGDNVFENTQTGSFYFPNSLTTISSNALAGSNITTVYATYLVLDRFNKTTGVQTIFGKSNVNIIAIGPGRYTPTIICFPENTPVLTDQGDIPIQDLEKGSYTINNNKVLGIVSMDCNEPLVFFTKNSLAYNVPNKNTYITQSHVIYHNNTQLKAIDYTKTEFHKKLCINNLKGIKQEKPILVKTNYQKVYNVVLESGHKMKVNNMLVETLHPSNELYKQKLLK